MDVYQLIFLIATPKLVDTAAEMFQKKNLPLQFRLTAEGTASSEIMDTLGLGSTDKGILISTVPKAFGEEMLSLLHTELRLDMINSGLAFTIPLTATSKLVYNMMNKLNENVEKTEMSENKMDNKYSLITTIVNRGFSTEVMNCAREAGAGGGTIVHSRAIENEDATGFWGLSVQEEREMVLILAKNEDKMKIMSAISEKFGIKSDAKGIVISLPIDSVMGL